MGGSGLEQLQAELAAIAAEDERAHEAAREREREAARRREEQLRRLAQDSVKAMTDVQEALGQEVRRQHFLMTGRKAQPASSSRWVLDDDDDFEETWRR
ncbi:hypothetical protein SAMN05421595_3043 [Austwickia chelonae]|uniref:Uncharacterized protein n=1 Tax=Austwickia chelonae NBRC 105200 TaxID=1184607 RepID=K6VRM3_9MICO|nr:hypothetical protein [Austwickia chelonae]GAB79414.1 hypothetical protein AUCHE_24_00690 [Austwickia chelonae NBRC 105200]SEW43397.1 hypothetical protein SAMN05421595_3043 [Austwickia chelonae]